VIVIWAVELVIELVLVCYLVDELVVVSVLCDFVMGVLVGVEVLLHYLVSLVASVLFCALVVIWLDDDWYAVVILEWVLEGGS